MRDAADLLLRLREAILAGSRLRRFEYPFPRGGAEKALASGTYPEISLRKTRDKRDRTRRDLCNDIYRTPKRLETHVFPYAGRTNAARIAGADLLAVLRDSGMGHLRAYSSRALHLQPRVEIGARRRAAVPG